MKLDELRKEINVVDDEIVQLFIKRMEIVRKIAQVKKTLNIPLTDYEREKAITERLIATVPNDMLNYSEKLIKTIISLSKEYQTVLSEENTEA